MSQPEEETGKKISITVKFSGGQDDINLAVKKTTPFSKIYRAVAGSLGVDIASFRLDWDGQRMGKDETPKMHEFSEEEQLDYHVEVVGGSSLNL